MTRTQLLACRAGTILGAAALLIGVVLWIVDMNNIPEICTPHTGYFGRPDGIRCRNGDPDYRGLYLAGLGLTIVVCTFIMWAALTPSRQRSKGV
ncbi:hypothetical protein IU421_14775 [Nocardia cyriacigeorgica]|uniref:hypothetical protein n=1 Tax=Nocardia cyriacigeorgica TaxID=135487 RepID=UPI0018941A67|nr:hypothetical protein [Nocardia cyriacigeorgica]MBF6515534.1 hypothetical protein [Nocardia cyriacigeorgica]